jgi:sorbitol-specific phosphotransferase system component IIBC
MAEAKLVPYFELALNVMVFIRFLKYLVKIVYYSGVIGSRIAKLVTPAK